MLFQNNPRSRKAEFVVHVLHGRGYRVWLSEAQAQESIDGVFKEKCFSENLNQTSLSTGN